MSALHLIYFPSYVNFESLENKKNPMLSNIGRKGGMYE